MDTGFFDHIAYWHWLILACALMVLEMITPGFFLMWIGFGASLVAISMLVFDMSLPLQIILFALFSMGSVLLSRAYGKRFPAAKPDVNLNQRGASYVGQVFVLDQPIKSGRGRLKLGDGVWNIQGPDLDAGQRVKVVGIKSTTLIVEKAE